MTNNLSCFRATSALDTESERVVQEALDNLVADAKLTTIIVAHRLSTIRGANKICYVDKGKICEVGTYEELMALPGGLFKRLESLQTIGDPADAMAKPIRDKRNSPRKGDVLHGEFNDEVELSKVSAAKEKSKNNKKKAVEIAREEYHLFIIGCVGAFFGSIMYVQVLLFLVLSASVSVLTIIAVFLVKVLSLLI